MNPLAELSTTYPVAHAIGVLSLVCAVGMALGSVKVRGVGLGTAGVLFAGILAGHLGRPVSAVTLEFVKEFGLVLFVFTIGLQLGPGFFATLREQGVRMNGLAAGIVCLGAAGAPLAGWLAGFDPAAVLGIFSGASINMPSLGAGVQALSTQPGIEAGRLALPALACAVTFPAAVLAVIGTLLGLERLLGMKPVREAEAHDERHRKRIVPLERRTLVVAVPDLDGMPVGAIPGRAAPGVTISRIRRGDETLVALDDTPLRIGDRLLAVGIPSSLDRLEQGIGHRSSEDLLMTGGAVTFRRVLVTDRAVLGRTIGELQLGDRLGVLVSRITRADLEMTAVPDLRLQFGDVVQIVGHEPDLERAAVLLGNSVKELNETHFIPLFLGILLGILVGTLPLAVPGFPQPLKLGLAGGPLLVALVLGRFGRVGRLVFHMPVNANLAFREFGIALFFAAVGLAAGPSFFSTVVSPVGIQWMAAGLCVTILPLVCVAAVARSVWRMDYVDLSGLLAGAMTAPPALAFATGRARSDSPTVAYAMVYPLAMLLRILAAQALALWLCG